jgi:hypothetical protein
VVRETTVNLLLKGVPFVTVDDLTSALYAASIGCVRGAFDGEEFGLSDSAPEHRFREFARNLWYLII